MDSQASGNEVWIPHGQACRERSRVDIMCDAAGQAAEERFASSIGWKS